MSFYNLSAKSLTGSSTVLFEAFKNKTVLIVNVASKCGYTNQYAGLQKLYESYKKDGLIVVGFPCNQFGSQEPGTPEEITTFCSSKYSVDFPLMEKIDVNGANTHPVYKFLKEQAGVAEIKWNFGKFLISKDAKLVKHFDHKATPQSLESEIKAIL